MNQKNKIFILSKILSGVSLGLLVLLPVLSVILWMKLDLFHVAFRDDYDVATFDIKTQALGMLFSLLPLSIWMFGLLNLRRLSQNYMRGRVFVGENARYIRNFAWMSILGGGLSPVFGGIYSIILSMNHEKGERFLSVGLGTTEIYTIILGLTFAVIAHVMEAAHKLSEENNQFV